MLREWLSEESVHREALAAAVVVPDPVRCVQCGICSYNCPMGIDVRHYAANGIPVGVSHCLTCGECVARCPRGTLRFERSPLFRIGEHADREAGSWRNASS